MSTCCTSIAEIEPSASSTARNGVVRLRPERPVLQAQAAESGVKRRTGGLGCCVRDRCRPERSVRQECGGGCVQSRRRSNDDEPAFQAGRVNRTIRPRPSVRRFPPDLRPTLAEPAFQAEDRRFERPGGIAWASMSDERRSPNSLEPEPVRQRRNHEARPGSDPEPGFCICPTRMSVPGRSQ
jgi:hypothetical protein